MTAPPRQYRVIHETRYVYSSTVGNGHHFAHLRPRTTPWQQVSNHVMDFDPLPAEISDIVDHFGNHTLRFLIKRPHEALRVTASSILTVTEPVYEESLLRNPWEQALRKSLYAPEPLDVAEMRLPSPQVECLSETRQYAQQAFRPGRPWLDAMLDLTRQIRNDFAYDPTATTVTTPVADVFVSKRGVCQDFAHLMLSCLRALQLPARYVSGYILNEPPPGVKKLQGADASHAWIESWFPGAGWVGFDPTNGKQADADFITLAWGREFMDVTPLRGVVLGGGEHEPEVGVSVKRVG